MKIGFPKLSVKLVILSVTGVYCLGIAGMCLYQAYLHYIHERYYPLNLRNLEALSHRLNVKLTVITESISVKSGKHQISLKPADIQYLNFYIPKLITELSKYPSEAISKIELKEVIIGRELRLDNRPCGGMQSKYLNMLFFDCSFVASDQWTRQVIHHEMFHLIDWKDGVVKYDAEWEKLNPPDFRYSSGGWSLSKLEQAASLEEPNRHGFLNNYSMSGLEEDKAEIFAHMVTDYKNVERRAKTDPIIEAKMSQMKKLLYEFCPSFNEDFWSKIQNEPISNAKAKMN